MHELLFLRNISFGPVLLFQFVVKWPQPRMDSKFFFICINFHLNDSMAKMKFASLWTTLLFYHHRKWIMLRCQDFKQWFPPLWILVYLDEQFLYLDHVACMLVAISQLSISKTLSSLQRMSNVLLPCILSVVPLMANVVKN